MLKQLFVLAFTANILIIKPSLANSDDRSTNADAESSCCGNGALSESRSNGNHHGRKLSCRKNEVMSDCIEGGCQAKTCSDLDRDIPCKKIDPKYCTKGCLCKDGYLRADNGTCIPISNCILSCLRTNEVFTPCPKICPPQVCESINQKYSCPAILIPTNKTNCRPACRCQPGYLRNKIKECISTDDCLKCTGPNEYYSCGGACDNVCATLSQQNQTSCPVVNIVCNKMCYCEEGYARAKNGTCIPFENCPEPQCPVNEQYVQCPSSVCAPRNCSQLGFPLDCIGASEDSVCETKPECICNDGYVRNSKGVCIPIDSCPSCGGDKNAKQGCGIYCGNRCSNYFHKGPVACPAVCLLNGCDCRPGKYYDDVLKKCVDPSECNPTCGKNEVVSNCVNGGCDKRNCSQINDPDICIDPITCKKGCVCKNGYLRHSNGTCVPTQNCPQTCGKNEEHTNCIESECRALNCSQLGFPLECKQSQSESCTKGCICKTGFLKNAKGRCIPAESCPSCGGDSNAVAGCGVNCNQHCYNIGKEPEACTGICYENACNCKKGFKIDDNTGKCVLPEQCTPVCKENEVYDDCLEDNCKAESCSQLGYPLDCNYSNSTCCSGGCVCKDDYLKADNGTCIPASSCPSCGGDTNAKLGCGIYCNRRCSNIGQEQQFCILLCRSNACDCKEGLYLDDNTGKCVLPKYCTPVCKSNEVYNDCVQGQCGPKTCSDLGKSLGCPRIDPKYCIKGCLCKEGYLKATNGTCVPREDCDVCGDDANAVPGCGLNCNKQCTDIGKKRICPRIACPPNGCECKDGYYYDSDKEECVLPEDCGSLCPSTSSTITKRSTPAPKNSPETTLAEFRKGNLAFAGALLSKLLKIKSGSSFVASSLSAMLPFTELAYNAFGDTLAQLLKFINLNNKDEIEQTIPALFSSFKNQPAVDFVIANKIYGNQNQPLSDKFVHDARTLFESDAESVNFNDPVGTAEKINNWVANITDNLIQNLISPNMLTPSTELVCVNALYFKGNWSLQFNPAHTKNRDFYITENNTKSIPTMYQEATFDYAEDSNLDAQIIKLDYTGGNFSFQIVLPRTIDGLPSLIEKLQNPDTLSSIQNSLSSELVGLYLPKMDKSTDINLVDILKENNVTRPFDPNNAEFDGILAKYERIHVSFAKQKARIQVDETGTKAAAATAVGGASAAGIAMPRMPYIFNANHGFVYYLFKQNDLLFVGAFTGQ